MPTMPPYAIEVLEPAQGWPTDLEFAIDAPLPGVPLHGLSVNFRGFVAPKTASAPWPRALVVLVQGVAVWRALVDLARPDLADSPMSEGARRMGMACGFDTALPTFMDLAEAPFELAAECESTEDKGLVRVPLARLRFVGGTLPQRHGGVGIVTVNSMGRSGSSILCRLLAQHSRVHVPTLGGQYGEVFAIGQLARSLAVLGSEGSLTEINRLSVEPDFMSLRPGFNGMDAQPDGLEQHCRDVMLRSAVACGTTLLQEGLDAVTALARARKPRAAWWVEKSWSSASAPLLGLLANRWREIVLVREPQSFLTSQALFLAKLGLPRHEMLAHLSASPDKFERFYRSVRSRRGFVHLVRYEDLIDQPRRVLEGLVEYLGLGSSKGFVDRAARMVGRDDEFHRRFSAQGRVTTGLPELAPVAVASLGPWFEEMCSDFGYEVPTELNLVPGA